MYCKRKPHGTYMYNSLPSKTPSIYNESRIIILNDNFPGVDESKNKGFKGYKVKTTGQNKVNKHLIHQSEMGKFNGYKNKCGNTIFNRLSVPVQTELYLEELTDKVEVFNCCVQTDEFLFRPETPLFVPAAIGLPVETQIEPNDLFDFDLEVVPILEVLVGKTIEQSLLEVMEEEELANLRQNQEVLKEIHNSDLMEISRLEAKNKRFYDEKKRRLEEYEIASQHAKETADKIAARAFTNAYLEPLLGNTYQKLLDRGYFYDFTEYQIQVNFVNSLFDGVLKSLDYENCAHSLLDSMICDAVDTRHNDFRELARTIYENQYLNNTMPEIRIQVTAWILECATRKAISNLKLAKEAARSIRKNIIKYCLNMVLEEITLEVIAQKEAEAAMDDTTESY